VSDNFSAALEGLGSLMTILVGDMADVRQIATLEDDMVVAEIWPEGLLEKLCKARPMMTEKARRRFRRDVERLLAMDWLRR